MAPEGIRRIRSAPLISLPASRLFKTIACARFPWLTCTLQRISRYICNEWRILRGRKPSPLSHCTALGVLASMQCYFSREYFTARNYSASSRALILTSLAFIRHRSSRRFAPFPELSDCNWEYFLLLSFLFSRSPLPLLFRISILLIISIINASRGTDNSVAMIYALTNLSFQSLAFVRI